MKGIPFFEQGEAREALKRRCREAKVPIHLVDGLIAAEIEQIGKRRKAGLWEKLDELLSPSAPLEGSEGEGD